MLIGTPAGAAKILVFGDSLSAAYGMPLEQGWVALLQSRLNEQGLDYQVINRSISGETTAGGRTRLPRILEQEKPAWVLLALGANDGLRGIKPSELRANLQAMIDAIQKQGAKVLLIGMHLPPNYGRAYSTRFNEVYTELAGRTGVALVPFLLEGVGRDARQMQDDGLHPRAEAQPRVLENVWAVAGALFDRK